MIYDNSQVRRQDRLLPQAEAQELLRTGEYGVLSLYDATTNEPYGMPINYVWDGAEAIYLHCAPEGRKLRCIDAKAAVSFCVVGATRVRSAMFTTEYASVVVRCTAHCSLSAEERRTALRLLLEKYSPDDVTTGLRYAEASFHRTEVIRLDIVEMSGKTKKIGNKK